MTSIQFVVHPLPGTQEQLQEKLKEVADRLNKYNSAGENGLTKKHIYRPQNPPLRLTTPFSLTHFCLKWQDPDHIFFVFSCNFGSASNSPDPEHWCRYRHGDYVLIDAVLYLLFFLLNRYERPVWDPRGGEADSSRSVPLCPPAGGWPAGEAPLLCHLRQVP